MHKKQPEATGVVRVAKRTLEKFWEEPVIISGMISGISGRSYR